MHSSEVVLSCHLCSCTVQLYPIFPLIYLYLCLALTFIVQNPNNETYFRGILPFLPSSGVGGTYKGQYIGPSV